MAYNRDKHNTACAPGGDRDLRNTVLNMLAETLEDGAFSHVVVNETFEAGKAEGRDRAFISRLYLGTLERLIYLDFCINKVSKTNTMKMKPVILNILRISAYQLFFMDAVPDHAALSEAGRLAARRGFKGLVPFVNGVLRNLQKTGREAIEKEMPANVRLSVPKWMYGLVCDSCTERSAREFFEGTLNAGRPLTIRLNTLRACEKDIINSLKQEGCSVEVINEGEGAASYSHCCYIKGFDSITSLSAYRKGLFSVQDISSVNAALAGCRALKGEYITAPLILDVCAAPGGKSICAAQEFPGGTVISRDISEGKRALIDENINRLGITNMRSEVHDATVPDENMTGRADMVIADLPCSGIGVIGRKPDIKLRLRQKDIAELAALQRRILETVNVYVKKGGILVYSTCTVTDEENKNNTRWFLKEFPFELQSEEQVLAGAGDGFYTAVFRRI